MNFNDMLKDIPQDVRVDGIVDHVTEVAANMQAPIFMTMIQSNLNPAQMLLVLNMIASKYLATVMMDMDRSGKPLDHKDFMDSINKMTMLHAEVYFQEYLDTKKSD
jgi:hypothetical protein